MNIFDDVHLTYLTSHYHGRLATIAPDGTPQNKPVGYRYNPEHQSIDIAGFGMERSAKYRNVAVNAAVAFVIDDTIGEGPTGMRFVEIRGRAEHATVTDPQQTDGLSAQIIRIYPRRIISWNVDPGEPSLKTFDLPKQANPPHPGWRLPRK